MSIKGSVVRTLCSGIAILVALLLLNIGVHRLRGPSADQERAIAKFNELNAHAPKEGNAFPLIWLMRYDVDDASIESLAADDVRRAYAMSALGEGLSDLIPKDRAPLAMPPADSPGLCDVSGSPCLQRVAENPEATRELVASYPRILQRAHVLETKSTLRNEFPYSVYAPIPDPGRAQHLRLSELALSWHDGNHNEAIVGVCRNAASWRRLRHDSNGLVFTMLAGTYLDSATRLFAEMLAELPKDEVLPEDCRTAFAPVAHGDVSLCGAMAGEWAMGHDALHAVYAPKSESPARRVFSRLWLSLVYSAEQTAATRAEEDDQLYCSEEAAQLATQDRILERETVSISIPECLANAMGCILRVPKQMKGYDAYARRQLDTAAHLRLAATLIWLRDTQGNARTLADRFAERPQNQRSGDRATGISDDGKSLWVENLDADREARFTLKLLAN
jgi:hypothetical protein